MKGESVAHPPLHILITTDVVGGVWDFCCVLSRELIATGNRVTLLALGDPDIHQRTQANMARVRLLRASLKLEWMQDSADDVRKAQRLLSRLSSDLEPDILHVNQFGLAREVVETPVVLTCHSDVLSWHKWTVRMGRAAPIPTEWSQYACLVRSGLLEANVVTAVSSFLADETRELYEIDREVRVIHNGWPAAEGDARPIQDRSALTLLAGRAWDKAKNVQLAAVAAQGWDSGRVVLVGDQRNPDSGSFVRFDPPIEALGRVSRGTLDAYLSEARLCLAPALYEPFGLLPLQAALAGCPLLLSDIPSFRELWDDAALFFRSGDASDLRRQWVRLLRDDELTAELARRARRRARERYSPHRMAHDYSRVYRQLLAENTGVRRDRRAVPV